MHYTTVPLKGHPSLLYTLLFFALNPCPQTKCHHQSLWLNNISSTPSYWKLQYGACTARKKESTKFRGMMQSFTPKATLIEYSSLMRRIKNVLTGSLDSAQMCFAEDFISLDWINRAAALRVEYCWYSKLIAFIKKGLEHGVLLMRFLQWSNFIESYS